MIGATPTLYLTTPAASPAHTDFHFLADWEPDGADRFIRMRRSTHDVPTADWKHLLEVRDSDVAGGNFMNPTQSEQGAIYGFFSTTGKSHGAVIGIHGHAYASAAAASTTELSGLESTTISAGATGVHVEGITNWATQGGYGDLMGMGVNLTQNQALASAYRSCGIQLNGTGTSTPRDGILLTGNWVYGIRFDGDCSVSEIRFKPGADAVLEFDPNDYLIWVQASSRWEFRLGGVCIFYIDSAGGHDGAPP